MAEYTFKEFQNEYPDDAACLKRIMEINTAARKRIVRFATSGRNFIR